MTITNTTCYVVFLKILYENFIMIHSLLCKLGYCEAIVPITMGYDKATDIVASLSMHESYL